MSAIGRINCTVGFCSVAIRRNCCTARCCSIWYCFFKRLSPFSWQKKPPVGLLCRRLRVATFYDLPGILELTAMTNIDSIGKEILMEMYQSGVKLVGSGIMTRAVIEE